MKKFFSIVMVMCAMTVVANAQNNMSCNSHANAENECCEEIDNEEEYTFDLNQGQDRPTVQSLSEILSEEE